MGKVVTNVPARSNSRRHHRFPKQWKPTIASMQTQISTFETMEAVTDETTPILDRRAFSGKVREHHRQLLAYGFALTADRELARDLVQDAFVAAYQNLGKFEVSRDFGAWMRGIVRNKWRDWVKRKKLTLLDEGELERLEAEHVAWEALRNSGRGDVFEALEDCVGQLPETLRGAVDAFYLKEKSGAEAAQDTGSSESSLRKRLQRARALLKDCLTNKSTDTPSEKGEF